METKPGLLARVVGNHRAHYLGLVGLFVRRELKVKYRGTFLGYLWSMLNPFFYMLIISFVFSKLVKPVPNYNLFLLAGILSWNIALQTVLQGANSIVQNANLLKKVRLPIWVFPMVPLGSSLTNFILALVPYAIMCAVKGAVPTLQILFLPLILFLFACFLYGIALVFATFNVFFRDVAHVLEPVMQIVFYATPIIYDRKSVGLSGAVSTLLSLNPFTYFVEAIRASLLPSTGNLDLQSLAILAGLSAAAMIFGFVAYRKNKPQIIFNL